MIWFDGAVQTGSQIPVDAGDRGLLLGDGLFETITVFGHKPFALPYHLDRITSGASILGFTIDRALCAKAVTDLCAHAADGRGVIRLNVTRGPGQRGLSPPAEATPLIYASLAPWRRDMAFQSVKLKTLTLRRNETSPLSRIKSLAYLDNVLGLKQAKEDGADDGLFLNGAGYAACSTMANLFAVKNGEMFTPPLRDGVLAGTIRHLLQVQEGELKVPVIERHLTLDDLLEADEIFLTNSVRLVMPVTRLDHVEFPRHAIAAKVFESIRQNIARECQDAI
ncbi:aminotransferase class IV [Methylovirgula sp. 4M-Z18]|uniref:aminotransferase class IV n=1 Tax=Methylovirgula sp. 4M-Z18 TaxID=2293567 RepID=UPI000E2FD7AD|nr:aminotransferase class IV [Methylovirgula sp. 4M-Z18]RFB78338.1 class IV aminotransferase [Methylovirgula sp. 4M-Z18]